MEIQNSRSHPNDLEIVDVFRFIWKLRWAALVGGAFGLLTATIVMYVKQQAPVSTFLVNIDRSSLPALTDSRDVVNRFNAVIGSSEFSRRILEQFLSANPDYKLAFEKNGYEVHKILQEPAVRGASSIAIEPGNNQHDYIITTSFPFIDTKMSWMQAFMHLINENIRIMNLSLREQVQSTASQLIEGVARVSSEERFQRSESSFKNMVRAIDLKTELWRVLLSMQSLNLDSNALRSAILHESVDRNHGLRTSDVILELAVFEVTQATFDGRLTTEQSRDLRNKIVAIKRELDELAWNEAFADQSFAQAKVALSRIEVNFLREIDPRYSLMPDFKLDPLMNQWMDSYNQKNRRKLDFYIFSVAIAAGVIVGSFGWMVFRFLHNNWSAIASDNSDNPQSKIFG
jgi:LPS O-antigen subunit length determinant protein (WzzB/FepE family)